MSELRELQQIARSTNRPIEYRKASPRHLPVAADKYLYGLYVFVLGSGAGAGWSALTAPTTTPLAVGVSMGSFVALLVSLLTAYQNHERRWQVEVFIDAPEQEGTVRPEIHTAPGHVRRPNVQLPPGWLDKLRLLVADDPRLSARRLQQHGLITDRNNKEQVDEALDRIVALGWYDENNQRVSADGVATLLRTEVNND